MLHVVSYQSSSHVRAWGGPILRVFSLGVLMSGGSNVIYPLPLPLSSAGEDYEAASLTLPFSSTVTSHQVSVTLLEDEPVEPIEQFNVILSLPDEGPSQLNLEPRIAIVNILDTSSPLFPTDFPPTDEPL